VKKKGFVNVSIVIERKTMGLEEVEMMAVVVAKNNSDGMHPWEARSNY